ncbi:hypothetical protein Cha6605_4229 [Chamaesiphon minutus PCC 6605]|uniref:Uncharacterized protein n=1 Tax=Chamaesiphon minutus (strain ATCC 27169 / PCC 6605) TaxID=1173020 RepID=K9UL38_CHAP6|nr:hypothetical protein Cha6605_4229 [Chamaesiphon minutus PCC 6605]
MLYDREARLQRERVLRFLTIDRQLNPIALKMSEHNFRKINNCVYDCAAQSYFDAPARFY